MVSPAGRRADITAGELDPRVRGMVSGRGRQADDQLGVVALLAEELIEDERGCETPRAKAADSQAAIDGAAQKLGRIPRRARRA